MRLLFCATLVVLTLTSTVVSAHLQLMAPPARFVYTANGIKTSPCGSGTRTNTVTPYRPGDIVPVTWKETVGHGGHFRIALSATESDFVAPTNLAIPATKPTWVLLDGIMDKTGTMNYTEMVTLPNQECPACVLQVIQVMSGTDGGNTGTFSGNYFTCADLRITASATGTGGAGGSTGSGGRGGGGTTGTGGRGATGGATGSGGATSTGGATASGGRTGTGTGGTTTTATGGTTTTATGGTTTISTGGTTTTGTGGTTTTGTGGATTAGTGGATTTGSGGTGPGDSGDAATPACACGVSGGPGLPTTGALLGILIALSVRRGRDRNKKTPNQKP